MGRLLLLVVLLGGVVAPLRADTGVVVEAAELKAEPSEGAAPRGRLEAGTRVERGTRSGGWIAVQPAGTGARGGWLRVWQVRAAPDDGGNPILEGLKRFSRAVSGLFGASDRPEVQQGDVTATIGVRGIKRGDFASASPDPAARQRVAGMRADAAAASKFAHAAGLARRDVGDLPAADAEARDWGEW